MAGGCACLDDGPSPDRYSLADEDVELRWRFDREQIKSASLYHLPRKKAAVLDSDRSADLLDAAIEADDVILKVGASETVRLSLAGEAPANLIEFRRRCDDWEADPPVVNPKPKGDA